MACAKLLLVPALLMVAACGQKESSEPGAPASKFTAADTSIQSRLDKYATVRLTTDLSKVSEQDRAVLGHFINAAEKIHDIFWQQAYGEPGPLLGGITDPALRSLVEINVGPWDRIDANAPFVAGVGPKPAGAQFYPVDMTKEEFEAFSDPAKTGLYSLVRRDEAGKLKLVPYSQAYATQLKPIAAELRSAAAITTDSQLKKYLELRATALETDDYRPSAALKAITQCYRYWIAYADLDGFRVDTVKHMDLGATRYFTSVINEFAVSLGKENFYLIGEITGGRARAVDTMEVTGLSAALGIDDVQDKLEYLVKGQRNPVDYFDLFRNSTLVGKE